MQINEYIMLSHSLINTRKYLEYDMMYLNIYQILA